MTKYYHLALDPYMACEISCPQTEVVNITGIVSSPGAVHWTTTK